MEFVKDTEVEKTAADRERDGGGSESETSFLEDIPQAVTKTTEDGETSELSEVLGVGDTKEGAAVVQEDGDDEGGVGRRGGGESKSEGEGCEGEASWELLPTTVAAGAGNGFSIIATVSPAAAAVGGGGKTEFEGGGGRVTLWGGQGDAVGEGVESDGKGGSVHVVYACGLVECGKLGIG